MVMLHLVAVVQKLLVKLLLVELLMQAVGEDLLHPLLPRKRKVHPQNLNPQNLNPQNLNHLQIPLPNLNQTLKNLLKI